MDFKLPFILLVIGVGIAGVIPFGISQQGITEPSMEIDMIVGQTQNPFRIQTVNNEDVFYVDPEGKISMFYNELTATQQLYDEIHNQLTYDDPNLNYAETVESGGGIYQYTYTVQSGDLPLTDTNGMFSFDDWILTFSATSQNNSGGISDCQMKVFVENVQYAYEADNSIADGSYWFMGGINADDAYGFFQRQVEEGDVIGVKMWSPSGVNGCTLNSIYIGVTPRIQINALTLSIAGFANLGLDTELDPTDPFTTGSLWAGGFCTWRAGTWENTGVYVNIDDTTSDSQKTFVKGDYWYCDSDGDAYFDTENVADNHIWFQHSQAQFDALFTDEPNALKWTAVNWVTP